MEVTEGKRVGLVSMEEGVDLKLLKWPGESSMFSLTISFIMSVTQHTVPYEWPMWFFCCL